MDLEKQVSFATILASSRGLAISIAVLWHVDLALVLFFPGYNAHINTFKVLWFMPLPMFFLLLGFSFSQIISRGRLGIVAGSVASYLYIYVIWAMAYHVLFYVFDRGVFEFGLVPAIKRVLLPAPELWFVVWMACSLFCCTLTRRVAAALQMILFTAIYLSVITAGYKIQNFLIYVLIFTCFGILYRDKFTAICEFKPLLSLSVCAPSYAIIAYYSIPFEAFSFPVMSLINSMLGIVSVVSFFTLIRRTFICSAAAYIGRNAFVIYITAPLWIFLDCKVLSYANHHYISIDNEAFESWTLPLCLLVLTQSVLTKMALPRKSIMLEAPRFIQKPVSEFISLLLKKLSLPPLSTRMHRSDGKQS